MGSEEQEIQEKSAMICNLTQDFSIHEQKDVVLAVEMLRKIREMRKKIENYWKTTKEPAKTAYKQIVAREKEMLGNCDEAESNLKAEILGFLSAQKNKEKMMETTAKVFQEEKADEILQMAERHEKSGDFEMARNEREEAEMIRGLAAFKVEESEDFGITLRKNWQIKLTNERLVPTYFHGIEIRPIDKKKILEIHRKNQRAKIPGVEFYQTESLVLKGEERK